MVVRPDAALLPYTYMVTFVSEFSLKPHSVYVALEKQSLLTDNRNTEPVTPTLVVFEISLIYRGW